MVSRRTSRLPRYVKPEQLYIGDLVRVTWETGDTERTITGRIARRDYEGGVRVFTTGDGHELFRWHPANARSFRITLLEESRTRYPETIPLF